MSRAATSIHSSADRGSLRVVALKLGLCASGYALLMAMSREPWAAAALLGTTLLTYSAGLRLAAKSRKGVRRATSRLAVPAAFLVLVALNVTGFIGTLTGTPTPLARLAGPALVALPFYLLAAAAYLSDVAGRKGAPGMPTPSLLDFALFMSLPFKLLAGPLEGTPLLRQIQAMRAEWRWSRTLVAWPWFVLGAFMKYVVANRLDPGRHLALTDPVASLAVAAVFELKFYFDFAGYSFMAYGAALACGLRISQNFHHPFLAGNVVLFWRRWHMSLGRYLTRYVLEPNLDLFGGRLQKLLFASGIFLVSAMWHGGTLNYLLWGGFHATCYFGYVHWIKRREVARWLAIPAMLAFFVFGRMLAIDADGARMLTRLASFFQPDNYAITMPDGQHLSALFNATEWRGLAIAAGFLALEILSIRLHGLHRSYHLFRRSWVSLALLVAFIFLGMEAGAPLYARI